MKSHSKLMIIVSLLFLMLIQTLIISNGSAFTKIQSIVVYPDADATTIQGDSTNYGSSSTIQVGLGNLSNAREIYMVFDLSDRPSNYHSAIITLWADYNSVTEEMNISVFHVTETWDESTISGTNEPAKGSFITNVTVLSTDVVIEIDVTSAVATGDYLSICLSNDVSNYVRFHSKESSYSKPRLYWYSNEEVDFTFTSPTSETKINNELEIEWETTGTISKVSLYLVSDDNQEFFIKSNIENTGNYTWTITGDYKGMYRIKIVDFYNSSIYVLSDPFEISASIPGMDSALLITVSFLSLIGVILTLNRKKSLIIK